MNPTKSPGLFLFLKLEPSKDSLWHLLIQKFHDYAAQRDDAMC